MPHGQGGTLTLLLSNVTAAVRASALPFSVAPVFSVMEARAIMFPDMVVLVPRVAELPTCQITFLAWARPMRLTLPAAVVSVEPIWKMNTAFGSPLPSRVTFPVIPSEGTADV